MRGKLPIYLARIRVPLAVVGLLLGLTERWHHLGWLGLTGFVMFLIGLGASVLPIGYVRSTASARPDRSGGHASAS
jgi:hypothetical protein